MQHISSNISPIRQSRGGRISSPRLRESIQQSEDFCGLEEDVNRYDLLLLVKRTGRAAGFTSRMVQLLDYYMAFTRDIDWEQGSQPVIYQSLSRTALDLSVSERQIQKLEKALFDVGAITWNDSGNHKRYGQRCPETGMILYAYGVDLTPLAYLKSVLEQKLHEKQLYDEAWMETKRQISWYRRQICASLAEISELTAEEEQGGIGTDLLHLEASYEEIAVRIRTSTKLEALLAMLKTHKALHETVLTHAESIYGGQKSQIRPDNESKDTQVTKKSSSTSDSLCVHKQNTNNQSFNKLNYSSLPDNCLQESRNDPSEIKSSNSQQLVRVKERNSKARAGGEENLILKTGLQHLTTKQALNAASSRFLEHMPLESRPMNWDDFVTAAYRLRPALHISQRSWADACTTLTRNGAAICLLLVDQAAQREENPVRKPAAYFNAMIARARAGELQLHKSIFGLLKRENEEFAANINTEKPSQRRG